VPLNVVTKSLVALENIAKTCTQRGVEHKIYKATNTIKIPFPDQKIIEYVRKEVDMDYQRTGLYGSLT